MSVRTDYDRAPLMLYWEITRACELACRHCRADAVRRRHPQELTTEEGEWLLEAVSHFEPKPHLVFTGGDPLQRPDLYHLVGYAADLGLTVSVTPSGTPRCTREAITLLKASGAKTLAFSLDGATQHHHDRIRGVEGSFERTLDAITWARDADLPIQINTLVAAETALDLDRIYRLVCDLGVQRWALFFLIATGRGTVLHEVSAQQAERILEWLYGCSQQAAPIIKTTEAHHFRRIASTHRQGSPTVTAIRQAWGIRDGAGIMFISHLGDVYPSGFLPVKVGNVRQDDPVHLYQQAPLFRQMRDPDQLRGKCGECEFRVICGGSRARAYAATGDPLESDPLCVYQPSQSHRPHAVAV